MSRQANTSNTALMSARPTRASLGDDAFAIALKEEFKSLRCLHVPPLAPYEYAGAIRYGSVRSIKFEFPEVDAA